MRELRVESREEMSVTGLPYGSIVRVSREIVDAAQDDERKDADAARREADKAYDDDIDGYRAAVSRIVVVKHVSRSRAQNMLADRGVFCPDTQPRSVTSWVVRAMVRAMENGAGK